VQVTLRLCDDRFGSSDEFDEVTALGDELEALVVAAAVGEFDGNEMGGGECVLFFYGPDADRLFATIEPALRASSLARRARVCKRHGDVGAREEIVELPG